MPYALTIGGKPTAIAWSQEVAKRYNFRVSRLGFDPFSVVGKPSKREFALVCILWLVLPQDVHLQFATAEDLHVAINHQDPAEVTAITAALVAIIEDMFPSAEKKSIGKKSPSRKSNSESTKTNGTNFTRPKRKR